MAWFVNLRIPLTLRRALTMIPAVTVLALGMDVTRALVLSQVVLSFGIPLAVIPLVLMTSEREVMGIHVNRPMTTVVAWICAIVIVAMNIFLIFQQCFAR
jgi:manganese transport protein